MRKKFSWGIPGKRFDVNELHGNRTPRPLNKNPFQNWDAKRSDFVRMDLVPQIIVGGGGPYEES